MADATERLLLQVDAATELLRQHLSEAEPALDRFEQRAETMARKVDGSIGKMGGRFGEFARLADDTATRAQRSFETSFGQVQKLAATAIRGPTIAGGINLGADDIRAGAAVAQEQARAFALIGEAAERAARAQGDTSEATRLFIQATAASRIEAEQKAKALFAEAGALERVEIELRSSAEAVDLFVGKHERIAKAAAEEERLAIATRDAAAAQKLLATDADRLRAAIDPMYAAQKRFNVEMDRADDLLRGGEITAREYGQAQAIARQALQDHAKAVAGADAGGRQLIQVQQAGTVSAGQQRQAMQQLNFQLNDIATSYALGTPLQTIFAQQSGQVFQALALLSSGAGGASKAIDETGGAAEEGGVDVEGLGDKVKSVTEGAEEAGGKFGAFAAVMNGPWGAAIIAASAILVPLVIQLVAQNDAVADAIDKLKADAEATETNRLAKEAFKTTLEGVTIAIREQDEALKASQRTQQEAAEAENVAAKRRLTTARRELDRLREELAEARADAGAANNYDLNARGGGAARLIIGKRADTRVAEIEAKIAAAEETIRLGEDAVQRTRIDLARAAAARINDPMKRINDQYDAEVAAAEKAALATDRVTGALTRQIAAINARRKLDVDAEQKRQSAARQDGTLDRQLGREVDVADATRIIAGIGGRVTSGQRSTERQAQLYAAKLAGKHDGPVAKPGTSAHETGNAIDVAYGPGISVASIRKAFAAEGVRLRKVLDEPRQRIFHVEFGKAGPSAATTAKREEAARQQLLDADTAYAEQERAAREKLLSATRKTAASEEQRDRLLVDSINAEADAQEKKIANQFEAGDLTLAQAGHLTSINEAMRAQRLQNVQIEAATRTIERRYAAEEDDLEGKLAQLRLADDLAVTEADRRKIAREMLDIEQQLRRKALERLRDTSQDPQEVLRAVKQIGRLPAIEKAEDAGLAQRQAGPIARYRAQLLADTSDMNEALERVAVDGFGRLEEAGTREIANILKLKGAFGELAASVIADLVRIAAKKAILAAIDGGSGGGEGGGDGGFFASLARSFGGGKAVGGPVDPSKWYVVGEEGPELFAPGLSGSIIPNHALREPRLPAIATGGSGGVSTIRVLLSGDLDARIDNRAAGVAIEVVRAAAPEIVDAATANTLAEAGRPRM